MSIPLIHTWRAEATLSLPFPKGRQTVSVQHIVRLEGQQNYTCCYFSNGTMLMVALTLKVLLDRLPPNALVRLHRKHAVNPSFVTEWNSLGSFVRLHNGETFTISRRRSRACLDYRNCHANPSDDSHYAPSGRLAKNSPNGSSLVSKRTRSSGSL